MKRGDGPWVLAATILGSSMVFIDGTVVNVALPAILADFHATMVDAQWVVEAYALFLAALLLTGGSLGDRLGRRRVFAAGVVVFAAASVGCGLAASMRQLVAARAFQGVGGALLVPGSLAILSASFPASQRGRAIGTWSGFTAITAAIGPVLGGWLIDHLSWRWAFFVNIPLAAAALAVTAWRVPESRDDKGAGPFDWGGAVLATLGLGGIVFALIESSELGWRDPRVLGAFAGGLLALGAFAVVERSAQNPMMPLRLFRSRNFTGANVLTLFLYGALASVFFLIPLDLIQVQGYTAAAAGAAVLPFILLMFLLSRWSGGLVHRLGSRVPLVAGPLIAAAGFSLFAVPAVGGSYWTTFFPAMVVLGLGMATSVAPLTTTVMSAVDRRHAGIASGINNAVSRTAGLLSVAILSAVMLHAFGKALERRLAGARVSPPVSASIETQRTKLAAIRLPDGTEGLEAARVKEAISGSFVSGFRLVMLIASGLSVLAAASAFVWIDGGEKVER
ncbi:MAG: MFS transporter [Acidobacteria bacterium]|nr:MFS transporter [Acidobacteriota bacterium]MCA1610240.1 MFS transporter [Acidobacteriota bacterium]